MLWLLPVPLIPANILVNSTAKKLVDSAICAILYLEVQIVQNVRLFAILVSINVPAYVKLVKTDVQYPILHRHQPLFELQLFLKHRKLKYFFIIALQIPNWYYISKDVILFFQKWSSHWSWCYCWSMQVLCLIWLWKNMRTLRFVYPFINSCQMFNPLQIWQRKMYEILQIWPR